MALCRTVFGRCWVRPVCGSLSSWLMGGELENINIVFILFAGFVAMASPGPATLTIAGTSMASGRVHGFALAAGVTTGSVMWSTAAAFGLGAIMVANAWVFQVLRYIGAAYLLFLAVKSAKSALTQHSGLIPSPLKTTIGNSYAKGLALHLTNPKAVLFFGALYSVGIPAGSSPKVLLSIIFALGLLAATIFFGYAFLFSSESLANYYIRSRRWFESVFAFAFGAAALKIFTTKISP